MLTFEQIEDAFPEGMTCSDTTGGFEVSAQWLHDFAHAIEAAAIEKFLNDATRESTIAAATAPLLERITELQASVRRHEIALLKATDTLAKVAELEATAPLLESIAELQKLSVTNILLQVVPGEDGMGEEVYAKSVEQVVDLLGSQDERLENFELGIDIAKPIKDVATAAIDALETAMNGIEWYQIVHPEHASPADGEADDKLKAALLQLKKVEHGNVART